MAAVACAPAELPPSPECGDGEQGSQPLPHSVPQAQAVAMVPGAELPVAQPIIDGQSGGGPTEPAMATVIVGQPIVGRPVMTQPGMEQAGPLHSVTVQQGGASRVNLSQPNPHESDYAQGFWIAGLAWLSGLPLGPVFTYLCCNTEAGLTGSFNGSGVFGAGVSLILLFAGVTQLASNSSCNCQPDGLLCERDDTVYIGSNAASECDRAKSNQTAVGVVLLVLGVLVIPLAAGFVWKGEQRRKTFGVNLLPCSTTKR